MLSNKLFSFKPVVIFFSKKKGWGEARLFKNAFHFTSLVKKKKNGCELEPRSGCAVYLSLLPRDEQDPQECGARWTETRKRELVASRLTRLTVTRELPRGKNRGERPRTMPALPSRHLPLAITFSQREASVSYPTYTATWVERIGVAGASITPGI